MQSSVAPAAPIRRSWNIARDGISAVLLVSAVLLPWNVYFGFGVPDGNTWLFVVMAAATGLSLISLAVTFPAHSAKRAAQPPQRSGTPKTRLLMNTPYLVVVAGTLAFTLVELLRYGGTGEVPGGIGPGAIAGVAGALLAAQPPLTGTGLDNSRFRGWFSAVRTVGLLAMALAVASVLYLLYWRTRFVIDGFDDPEYGSQNVVVAVTALIYGVVALIVVLVGLRWLIVRQAAAMLATVALGASTVLGVVLVWVLGVGREIDAFHGIAQATSTAGVGYEGYLAWVVGAAILGPLALQRVWRAPLDRVIWQGAVGHCLTLIAVYCVGSVTLRIVDLVAPAVLGLPASPYDNIALLAFDVVAAVVAVWLRFNVKNPALHPVVVSAITGVLVILTVCRVVVGVGLAQRILYMAPPEGQDAAVYGNSLVQQITSTFDVVVCFLAAAAFVMAYLLQRDELRQPAGVPAQPPQPSAPPRTQVPVTAAAGPDAATSVVPAPMAGAGAVTQQVATGGNSQAATQRVLAPAATQRLPAETEKLPTKAPKIARPVESSTQRIKIATPAADSTKKLSSGAQPIPELNESTQRFPAGTTYTGTGRPPPPADEAPQT